MFEHLLYVSPKSSDKGFDFFSEGIQENQSTLKTGSAKDQYLSLWQDVVDTIDQDPLVQEYKKLHQGAATSYVLNQLANHYVGNTELANKITQMGRMHQAAVDMMKGNATLANAGHDQSDKESKMEVFLKNLNSINGQKYNLEKYQTNPNLATFDDKSLLDLAYGNGFKKVQDGPETLLTIRLGQLCKELVNKVQLIDNYTRIVHLNQKNLPEVTEENPLNSLISQIPGDQVDEYFQEQNRLDNESKEALKQTDMFYADLDEISTQITKEDKAEKLKEFLQKYNKELEQVRGELSKENIDRAISDLENTTRKHAEEYIQKQYVIRQDTKKENEILKQNYEKAMQNDAEIHKSMDRILSEKDRKMHELDNAFEDIQKEKRSIMDQRAQEKYEAQRAVKAYEEKEKPLLDKMNTLIDDARTTDIQSGILESYMNDGTADQLRDGMKEINERIDAMSELDRLLLDMVQGAERKGDVLNKALSVKDKSFDKIPSKATPEMKLEYIQLKHIQDQYNILKTQHPEWKEYFDIIDEKRVKLGKPAKDGMAYDRLMEHLQKAGAESRQMYKDGQPYYDAIGFLEKLNKRYNNKLPTMQDVKKLDDELSELRKNQPKSFNEADFDAQTKEMLASLEAKEEKIALQQESIEKEYVAKNTALQNQLQNPQEPTYAPIKSDEQILQEMEDLKNRECNEKVKEQIRHEERNKITPKEMITGLKTKVDKKREVANGIQSKVGAWKEKVNAAFQKENNATQQIKGQAENYREQVRLLGEGKNQFYKNVADLAGDYSKNMNQGMKKGHENSKEFTAMANAVANVKAKFDRYTGKTSDGPVPTKQELLESLSNMSKQSDAYIAKKNKGIHWIPSDQYFIRMDLANKLKQFGADMAKQMGTMDQMEKGLQSYLENPPTENNGRTVLEGESATDYVKRQCKAYFEKNKIVKNPEKDVKKEVKVEKKEPTKERTDVKKKEDKVLKKEDNRTIGAKGF